MICIFILIHIYLLIIYIYININQFVTLFVVTVDTLIAKHNKLNTKQVSNGIKQNQHAQTKSSLDYFYKYSCMVSDKLICISYC